MRPVDPDCRVCGGTGYDEAFGSECGWCATHGTTNVGIGYARPPRRQVGVGALRGTTATAVRPPAPVPVPVAAPDFRWAKTPAGVWAVQGPQVPELPATVTVGKANGDTSEVTVHSVVGTTKWGTLYGLAPAAPTAPLPARQGGGATPVAQPRWQPTEGQLYLHDGVVVKAVKSGVGRLYTKKLVGTRWDYAPEYLRLVTADEALTKEAAAEYGRRTGVCCVCGRTLTDPKSIEAGIGPRCASRSW